MNKCLVTKLQGVVNDNSLRKIGEGRFKFERTSAPNASTQKITLQFSEATDIEIIGDGYFTDSSLATNKGKKLHLNQYESTDVYFSNDNLEISFEKYKLASCASPTLVIDLYELSHSRLISNVSLLNANVEGDISALKDKAMITGINLRGKGVFGNLSKIKDDTKILYLNLLGTNVSGDLSAVSGMTQVNTLNLLGTNVSGDLSAVSGMTQLTDISLSKVTGNITNIKKAKTIYLSDSAISGDIASLPKDTYYLALVNDKGSSLTWSSRSSANNIIAINAPDVKIDNIDKMLQDQAECVRAYPSSGESWFKTIICKGTRTSVSDSAVSALQSKGYTVSVTPVE